VITPAILLEQPTRTKRVHRCAVYTRVSTEEQVGLEYNSLRAQEDLCKTYLIMRGADPAAERTWEHLGTYSDPGYSGGILERPALKRLLLDVEAGRIDLIVCYKIDRLSRSIHQFYRIWELLERHRVDLVSATQDLNTTTSQGKLMLNMLLSFGQFEREQIGERTRDKVAAARRRGRWTGGVPVLGYDVDPRGGRIHLNEAEAVRVREIFALYLRERSLTRVVEELGTRGWTTKTWIRRDGVLREGSSFDKPCLLRLLKNPLYTGKVHHRGSLHPGEQPAIVDEAAWTEVQGLLRRNGSVGYQGTRASHDALLKGLLFCAQCGSAMTPTWTGKSGRRYRYYRCLSTIKKGAHACPTGSVPALDLERRVVERIREIGRDPGLVAEVVRQARVQVEERRQALRKERRRLKAGQMNGRRATRIPRIQESDIGRSLSQFNGVWDVLLPWERSHVFRLLAERIDYDGQGQRLTIAFRSDGVASSPAPV
jgi:site-specific DNA recombinase